MASKTQSVATVRPQLPALDDRQDQDLDEDELAFYEGTLRLAERDGSLQLRGLDVRPGCNIGDNFASIVTRNTAHGVRGNGSAFQRSLIVKRAPQRDEFRCLAAFAKETDAYCELVPVLRGLCQRAGLRLPLARCLHASRLLRPDHIVLEDLAPAGYSMRPRQQGMDREHALLTMEALGRFHGASLALRRVEPRAFRRLRAQTDELIFFAEAEAVFSPSLQASATLAVLSLRRSGRADLARRLAARVARRGVFQEMCDAVRPPAEDGVVPAVFTHGDCWANNLLFRYDQDGRPCETKIIDLGGIRCSSPALDILHFMYTSLPREARTQHREELLEQYLDALRETVEDVTRANQRAETRLQPVLRRSSVGSSSEADASTQEIISLERLEDEMQKRSAFGLWIGLWMLPAIFFSPDILPVSDAPVDYFSEETQVYICKAMPKEFHQRVRDLVEEYAENGTL